MNAEMLDNAKRIFNAAAEMQDAGERSAYLDEACGGDQRLRAEIEDLLRRDVEAGSFLDAPAPDLAVTLDLISERPGIIIGRYKLLEKIGEGGMGVVYMAEQREPVRRKVALKIIKPGLDTREVIARFEAERQALAMMDHPNIAHVLDGGATKSGRPYFVMELVQGIPITTYCDQAGLTTRQRLELFVLVCQAVHHAHQKGIIHRDVKPSNVLVTLHDGVPVPKIIDFGIAKATHGQLTEKTLFTGYGRMMGTPLYMSPEQAEMSGLDVDTRSDIYSLGVVLYELLTGTTPFDRRRLHDAGLDEVRRVIREEEPPRPSHRLSTLDTEAISTVTAYRGVDARRLGRLLRGDLDWMVMKALEKDRTRRYESAADFARDIERYLANEPIEARPPTVADRAAKWSRRHRPVVWSSIAVLLIALAVSMFSALLIAGAYQREKDGRVLADQQRRIAEEQERLAQTQKALADRQKAEAETQRQQAETNLQLALEVLDQIYVRFMQRRMSEDKGNAKWNRGALLQNMLKFYDRFAQANENNPAVTSDVELAHRTIVEMGQSLVRQFPRAVGYRRSLGVASGRLGAALVKVGKTGEAEQAYRAAIPTQDRLVERFPSIPEYRTELSATLSGLADIRETIGQKEEAARCRDRVKLLQKGLPPVAATPPPATIHFADFSQPKDVFTVGEATFVEKRLRLAPAGRVKVGGAWFARQQPVLSGFETAFRFVMSRNGTEGFAFVVQNAGASALGPTDTGAGLGYGDEYPSSRGIPRCVAIEFDTYCGENDIGETGQHVSIQTRGADAATGSSIYSLDSVRSPISLNDGGTHAVIVRYVPGSLEVFLDGAEKPILSAAVELQPILGPEDGRAWVGFTAAAGVGGQCHEILGWDFRPLGDPMGEPRGENWPEQLPRRPDDRGAFTDPTAVQRDEKALGIDSASDSAGLPAVEIAQVAAGLDRYLLTRVLGFYTVFARQPHVAGPELRSKIGTAYWRIGDIQRQMGRSEQCLAAYEVACQNWRRVVAERPDVFAHQDHLFKAYQWAAWACIQMGQYQRAVDYCTKNLQFTRSCVNVPSHVEPSIRERRGRAYDALRQYDRAIEDYTKAIQAGVDVYDYRAGARFYQGDYRVAIQDYTEVLRRHPNSYRVWGFRAEAYGRIGEWDKAIADAGEAIRLSPNATAAYNVRARAYLGKNQLDRARADYEKAIELQPTEPLGYNDFARHLVTFGDRNVWNPGRAVELAQKAVELAENEPTYWNTLGVAEYRNGNQKLAIESLAKAVQLRSGGDAYDWFFLAMAHGQVANSEVARRWYDKAVEWTEKNKPNDEELLRFRAEAAELLGIRDKPPAEKQPPETAPPGKEASQAKPEAKKS